MNPLFPEIKAVVLTGGKALRMGGINKSLIKFRGERVIDRTIRILRPLFGELILAGWPDDTPAPGGVVLVSDNVISAGPLGGIEAAMNIVREGALFVFGGDMPGLNKEIISVEAELFAREKPEVLVPRTGTKIEPLHAIYNCTLHSDLKEYLQSGARPAVRDFIAGHRTLYLDLGETEETRVAFMNINRPEDLL